MDDHQLTIETPEHVELEFHIAGIGSRFMAFAIDSLYQFIGYFLVVLVMIFASGTVGKIFGKLGENWSVAIAIILGFSLYWGYFAFFEAIWKGQTPGKRSVGIRVVKDSGRPINTFEAISRNLLRSIDQLPGVYVFGLICMVVSKENRRIGDYVAGTVVVHERSAELIDPDLQELTGARVPALATDALTATDLELMETFLHRRLSLTLEVRQKMAAQISTFVADKLGTGPEPGQSAEDYLSAVARAVRDGGNLRS
ncbi:MAG: RDD family protein [Terriglobales bacterium]